MANYTTSADLIKDILFRAGEPTDGSSEFDDAALLYLNRAYQTVWMGGSEFDPTVNEIWWWLYTEGRIQLLLNYEDTFDVTLNSATVTSSANASTDLVGAFFQVTDNASNANKTIHKITAISGTTITLDSSYLGATATGLSGRIFKVDYDLSDKVLRLVSPMTLSITNDGGSAYSLAGRDYQVLGVSNRKLAEIAPVTQINEGYPRFFAQLGENKVRFDRSPASGAKRTYVDYAYLKRPDDLANDVAEPLVPRQYRKLLSDLATFFLLVDKNDNRADAVSLIARAGLRAMAVENRTRLHTYGAHIKHLAPMPTIEAAGDSDQPPTQSVYQPLQQVNPNA